MITIDGKYDIEARNYYFMDPKNEFTIENKQDEILEILYLSHS